MLLDIVILPPAEIQQKLTLAAKKISKQFKLEYAIDNRKLFSHITLFHLNSSPKKIQKQLTLLLKNQKYFSLRITNPQYEDNYFGLGIRKSPVLYNLHKKIVLGISDFRIGAISHLPKKASQTMRANVRRFGSRSILRLYRPYFTVGYVKYSSDIKEVIKILKRLQPQGQL